MGRFWRLHWYERGLTNCNPGYDRRFRINAPEAVLHPQFGHRVEARENGLMLIRAEEDLFQLVGAELYCEFWGGHPGTANPRVTVNGRSTYRLPPVGTEQHHCTYSYPSIPLKLTDLVNGWNAFHVGHRARTQPGSALACASLDRRTRPSAGLFYPQWPSIPGC